MAAHSINHFERIDRPEGAMGKTGQEVLGLTAKPPRWRNEENQNFLNIKIQGNLIGMRSIAHAVVFVRLHFDPFADLALVENIAG